MERAVALKKLRNLLGKHLGYRVDPKAPSAEEREEAKRQLKGLTEARQQAEKAMTERRQAILAADQQFQQLLAEYDAAKKRLADASGTTYRYRFTVGTTTLGPLRFFHVKAQGDSWEEVIAKLQAEKKGLDRPAVRAAAKVKAATDRLDEKPSGELASGTDSPLRSAAARRKTTAAPGSEKAALHFTPPSSK